MPARPTTYEDRQYATYNDAMTAERAAAVFLVNKISWGAVFAGALLALTLQLILNMFGIGIGAATIDPAVENGVPSAPAFSIGAAIWWMLSGIIAAFCGGYVASRLSGKPSVSTGCWHGLTAWALSIVVIFYLLTTTLGAVAGGAYSAVSNAGGAMLGATGSIAQSALGGAQPGADGPVNQQSWNQYETQVEQELTQLTGGLEVQEIRQSVMEMLRALISQDQFAIQEAREEAIGIIAESQDISRSQAQERLNSYIQQAQTTYQRLSGQASQFWTAAQQNATQVAEEAAETISRAAWASAIALILGAAAAWFGGRFGTVREPV